MSAIRILILGVLLEKPALHGYDVRRELELWNAEQWANIAYGSIYFALNKMAEEGLVEAVSTDQIGKRPARTSYAITPRGRQEFERLLRQYWWEIRPVVDPFQVAITFMNYLPREELLATLRQRASTIRAALESFPVFAAQKTEHPETPHHISAQLQLLVRYNEVTLEWLETTIAQVERGELP